MAKHRGKCKKGFHEVGGKCIPIKKGKKASNQTGVKPSGAPMRRGYGGF